MLKLDLVALERAGSLAVAAEIPESSPLWDESGLRPAKPLSAALEASVVGSGEIVVRGTLSGRVGQACRRCLEPIEVPLELDVTFVFAPPDALGDEGDVRPLDENATELDLAAAIREELVLSVAPYAVCTTECRGLCPGCGVNLNDETCQCSTEARDPRWDALRALKTD